MGEIDRLKDFVEVQEGLANVLVPRAHAVKGPGKVGAFPFYNKTMAFPRDVSVLILEAVGSDVNRVLDGLSSTGILGIRFSLESAGDFDITLNDRRPDAKEVIAKNLVRNEVSGATVTCEDLNVLLHQQRFDYVDIDPFGTPIRFLESALRSLRAGGYLAVTATDTAVLAGAYPKTCFRRYGARSVKAPFGHELGVRILVGAVVRTAAKYDLAARPLLTLWIGHCYKAFLEVEAGAGRADRALAHLGNVTYEPGSDRAVDAGGDVGPMWVGDLHQLEVLRRAQPKNYMPAVVSKYHELWQEEAEAPPLFFTTDEVASRLRMRAPPLRTVLRTLRESGFQACRTSFDPKGFKTDATWANLGRLMGSP